jgi:hypothetical protein
MVLLLLHLAAHYLQVLLLSKQLFRTGESRSAGLAAAVHRW